MKREIKFKAWDVKELKMSIPFTFSDIQSNESYGMATTAFIDVLDGIEVDKVMDCKKFILMQYTGLPFDICEGDIISPQGNTNHPLRYIVLWNTYNCCFSAFLLHEYLMIVAGDLFDKTNVELSKGNIKRDWILEYEVKPIGNIHETPELLEDAS